MSGACGACAGARACNVCVDAPPLVAGRMRGGRVASTPDLLGVVERLLDEGDRVAQLTLDGGLRRTQRARQVLSLAKALAVLDVHLRAR